MPEQKKGWKPRELKIKTRFHFWVRQNPKTEMGVVISTHLHQGLKCSVFLILVILLGMYRYVVLICTPLMNMLLRIFSCSYLPFTYSNIVPLAKYHYSNLLPIFIIGCFYILYTSTLLNMSVNIFCQ